MKYWLGVIGSIKTYERFMLESDSWFCMPKSCEVGDCMVMYASIKVAKKKAGVFGFYEVLKKDETKDGDCRTYGIFSGTGERPIYVELKLIDKLETSIPFHTIQSSPRLADTPFVRRNFQATYFSLTDAQYKAFLSLSKKVNKKE